MLDTVIGPKSDGPAANNLLAALQSMSINGTIYIGYPVLSNPDEISFVDAMLTSEEHGVVIFNFMTPIDDDDPDDYWAKLEALQADLFASVETKLKAHRELRNKRELAVPIAVVGFGATDISVPAPYVVTVANHETLASVLADCLPMPPQYREGLNAAVQRVSNIKPINRRANVKNENSKAGVLRKVEANIANLDKWQKKAAVETPEGPQRIRGLAGSGKTIVLALKAAYLHARNPDWTIAITFHTRSLYQQFEDLIDRLSLEHVNDKPDLDKLKIRHSWGGQALPGIYSDIAVAHGVPPKDLIYAKNRYGSQLAFDGLCKELIEEIDAIGCKRLYDAVLIDEAQDFPRSFFQLIYRVTAQPKRIIWAYDELQNLGDFSMSPPAELFGIDEAGNARVELHNEDAEANQDIILPLCYRNPPWTLSVAHALGFGLNRIGGAIQTFDDPALWEHIGYEVCEGEYVPGKNVRLRRKKSATPEYFRQLLSPSDSLECHSFASAEAQAIWVADSIEKNVTVEELGKKDVLVVTLDPIRANADAAPLIRQLQSRGIVGHIVGVTASGDKIFTDSSLAVTGIYRAKGNEAPVVYVINAQYGFEGAELIKKRNSVFTAMTRSRAWTYLCGYGPGMDGLKAEFDRVKENNFELEFEVLTTEQSARLRKIHRDMTSEELDKMKSAEKSLIKGLEILEDTDLSLESISPNIRARLKELLEQKD